MKVEVAALDEWNAAIERARREYRNHPLIDSPPIICCVSGCDSKRLYGRSRCSLHYNDRRAR